MSQDPKRETIIEDLSSVSRRDLVQKLGPAAAMVGLAGCSGDSGSTNTTSEPMGGTTTTGQGGMNPVSGGTLNAGMKVGIETMDGRSVTGLQSMQVLYNIHSKLMRFLRVDGELQLVGDLATDWEYEDDTTLRVDLNEDAVFHNGEPVTAEDVVYTFRTMYDKPQFTASLLFPSGISFTARDEHTVEFDTGDTPQAALVASLGFIVGIVSKKADQNQDLSQNPVGSGPFKFEEWVDGDHVYVNRFEDYWKTDENGNQLPYLDRIEFNIYPDSSTKIRDLQSGQLDWVDLVPSQDISTVRNASSLNTSSTGPGGFMGIFQFNTSKEPFSDVNFRKAFLHAMNWKAIIEIVYKNAAKRANNQPLPPRTDWNIDGVGDPYQGQNPEKAQEFLNKSSIDPGSEPLFTNWVGRGLSRVLQTHQLIQQQVKEVLGVNFEINQADGSVVFKKENSGQFGFTASGFDGMYDPDQILTVVFKKGAFFNYGEYVNDEIQTLLKEGRQTLDRETRQQKYRRIYEINNEEAAKYFPYWENVIYAHQKSVTNWKPKLDQLWWFEEVWKSQ